MVALDVVRQWSVPVAAGLALIAFPVLATAGMLPSAVGLAGTVLAGLVLCLYAGVRPLLAAGVSLRARLAGAGLALVWLAACYAPFHARIFPGAPLVDGARVTSAGSGLPLTIAARGHGAIDLVLTAEGTGPGDGAPLRFRLTVAGGGGEPWTTEGAFDATERRGSAGAPPPPMAELPLVPNPARADLVLTELVLEPATDRALAVSAFPHPVPDPLLLGLAAVALIIAVAAVDRLGPLAGTDGALTLATGGVAGTAAIFWTSRVVHPTFSTLTGSAIFGGLLGSAAGSLVWWIAKRLIAEPAR